MKNLTSLKDVYFYIEKKAHYINFDNHKIDDLFISLRNNFTQKGHKKISKYCQIEIDFFGFKFSNGKLESIFSQYNAEGVKINYPDIKKFTKEDFEYLLRRFNFTQNLYLKSWYGNILFFSNFNSSKIIEDTIEAYLEMYNNIPFDLISDNAKRMNNLKLEILENSFYLSQKSNYKLNFFKNEFLQILKIFDSSILYDPAIVILRLIYKNLKIFDIQDVEVALEKCWEICFFYFSTKDFYSSVPYIQLGIKFQNKLKTKKYNWKAELAKVYEGQANKEFSDIGRDLITLGNYEEAIMLFKEIKNYAKVDELTLKYEEVKKRYELEKTEQTIDITELVKEIEEEVNVVLEYSDENLFFYMCKSKRLIPHIKKIKENIKNEKTSFSLFDIIGTSIIDRNGNSPKKIPYHEITSQNSKGEESLNNELNTNSFYHYYTWELEVISTRLLSALFWRGFLAKKVTFNSLIDFMDKHCWFFKNSNKRNGDVPIANKWKTLLLPSMYDFFQNLDYMSKYPTLRLNCMLSIDSISIKIEGLIRDICRAYKIPVTEFKRDNNNKSISMEKDLNNILYSKGLENIFNEDDLFFFKYMLVDQSGLNIRNNVAHSFFEDKDYTFFTMYHLILILLKIGTFNYVFESKKNNK